MNVRINNQNQQILSRAHKKLARDDAAKTPPLENFEKHCILIGGLRMENDLTNHRPPFVERRLPIGTKQQSPQVYCITRKKRIQTNFNVHQKIKQQKQFKRRPLQKAIPTCYTENIP